MADEFACSAQLLCAAAETEVRVPPGKQRALLADESGGNCKMPEREELGQAAARCLPRGEPPADALPGSAGEVSQSR